MTLYHLRYDFEPKHTDLVAGYYTRHELGIDEILLLKLLEDKVIQLVDVPLRCTLIAENGFEKTIETRDFRNVISIANYGRTSIGHHTFDDGNRSYHDFEPVKGKTDFRFIKKIYAKNEFIYQEI